MSDVTCNLSAIERGDSQAAGQLLPPVYDELRKRPATRLAREAQGQSLQATAPVHVAYLRLVGTDPDRPLDGRGHSLATVAESSICYGKAYLAASAETTNTGRPSASAGSSGSVSRGRPRSMTPTVFQA